MYIDAFWLHNAVTSRYQNSCDYILIRTSWIHFRRTRPNFCVSINLRNTRNVEEILCTIWSYSMAAERNLHLGLAFALTAIINGKTCKIVVAGQQLRTWRRRETWAFYKGDRYTGLLIDLIISYRKTGFWPYHGHIRVSVLSSNFSAYRKIFTQLAMNITLLEVARQLHFMSS
jgi:hypothetical protein